MLSIDDEPHCFVYCEHLGGYCNGYPSTCPQCYYRDGFWGPDEDDPDKDKLIRPGY